MSDDSSDCAECAGPPRLSRRAVFRAPIVGGGALVTTAAFGSAHLQTAYAATASAPAVVVVLSMRGAMDGMSLVVPHGDPVYALARPNIAIPTPQLLVGDAFFGLHPDLAPLLPLWQAGRMAAVHGTGLPAPNRSHFSAMQELEDAAPGSTTRTGWLNRLIGQDTVTTPLEAVQIGDAVPPTSLMGPAACVAIESIDAMRMAGADQWDTMGRRRRSMATMWGHAGGPLGAGARAAMQALDGFAPVRATAETPLAGALYPKGDLGDALAAAVRVIKGDVGAQVITLDYGDWDHHADLGTLAKGRLHDMATEFAQSMAAFFVDLGTFASKVTVVALSEFGRRTVENSTFGTDHGYGNVMLLFGAGVNGGYHGTWTPLANVEDDDLMVTTDYRSVLSEVVTKRLGVSTAQVFPGFQPETVGVMA
ncbi:DUF1501 domain-containing protein [Nocardioides ultimimeridianus]